ncbi:MAG: NTP transferase domain-containing protein [Chitinophagaceae bacterium]|nr:NTP transferase domain-containing protein [Chitinophagaceae bacterium]MCB9044798.1 NTP transferase domain-containing protein [Chitinophagales bacterium]
MISKETKLYGLVLAGGKSQRMGHDKSIIEWHGKEQRYYVADLLQEFCDEVYISCRAEQQNEIDNHYQTLVDKIEVKGPAAGILTALFEKENTAWLVVACDLPLLYKDTLQYLIDNRDQTKVATTFKSPHDGLPEPLITIWEPKAKEALLSFVETGHSCPRKALINSDTYIIEPQYPEALINANTPEDAERVRDILTAKMNTTR